MIIGTSGSSRGWWASRSSSRSPCVAVAGGTKPPQHLDVDAYGSMSLQRPISNLQNPQKSHRTMEPVDRRPERKCRRKKLHAIKESLDQVGTLLFSPTDLKTCNVRHE